LTLNAGINGDLFHKVDEGLSLGGFITLDAGISTSASSAYSGAAAGALKRRTCGRTSEFDKPCGTWKIPPIG